MASHHRPSADPQTFDAEAADASWAARWEWQRLAALPAADRITLVTDQVWQRGYTLSYLSAYATVAGQVAAAATRAATANSAARASLHRLAGAAIDAADQLRAEQILAPPADRRTLAATQQAVADVAGQPQPWKPLADTAWTDSVRAGTIAGTLGAATDILIGWRTRDGQRLAEKVSIDAVPARTWVADLLATVNRDTVAGVRPGTTDRHTAGPARLAAQDQAPGAVTAATAGPDIRPALVARTQTARGPDELAIRPRKAVCHSRTVRR